MASKTGRRAGSGIGLEAPRAENQIRRVRRQLFNVVTGQAPAPPAPADTGAEH